MHATCYMLHIALLTDYYDDFLCVFNELEEYIIVLYYRLMVWLHHLDWTGPGNVSCTWLICPCFACDRLVCACFCARNPLGAQARSVCYNPWLPCGLAFNSVYTTDYLNWCHRTSTAWLDWDAEFDLGYIYVARRYWRGPLFRRSNVFVHQSR
jgi:hypothetical protein